MKSKFGKRKDSKACESICLDNIHLSHFKVVNKLYGMMKSELVSKRNGLLNFKSEGSA